MQLFILDRDYRLAVEYLADIHLIKMCLETAQILSAVVCNRGQELPSICPKPYNVNHPVVRAIRTPEQTAWVINYNGALHQEYSYRFGKLHVYCRLTERYSNVLSTQRAVPSCENLARVFKDYHTDIADIVEAHRAYYRYKMSILKRPPRWSKREMPPFLLPRSHPF